MKNYAGRQRYLDLLDDFSGLLRDALDLMRALQGADDHHDRTFIERPAIEAHEQNSDHHDWTAMLGLTRNVVADEDR